MAYFFERILTEGIAELSYLIGDSATGVAAVIDPRADVDVYMKLARQRQVSIRSIFETHIHADMVSGARELAVRCGTAEVFASVEGGETGYGFEVHPVHDGDTFALGAVTLTARHTPGHTPEHVSYEIAESDARGRPFAVFTGDSLFVNSAGRPDLLGEGAHELASQLYDTLFKYYAKLDPGVIIYPSHGSGSPCGASIGDRMESTIGYEMQRNPFFHCENRRTFIEHALSSVPPEPAYYRRMKKINEEGPQILGCPPRVPALAPAEFHKRVEANGAALIDTRHLLAFGGGHIPGALNIGAGPMLTVWAGWLLDPDREVLLVLSGDSDIDRVTSLFRRSGFTKFAGFLAGGMTSWENSGLPLEETPQLSVHELRNRLDDLQLIDVRSPGEWEGGHLPGARHIFLPEIRDRASELDRRLPVATYCASGYRASIAASLLQHRGFDAWNVPGSWQAWIQSGFDVEESKAA